MLRKLSLTLVLILVLTTTSTVYADAPIGKGANGLETAWEEVPGHCVKISSGQIKSSTGDVLTNGFDEFGYNYQSHLYNGTYDGADRKLDNAYWGQTGDFVDDHLVMKWSDDWLSNVDCNGDGLLDRGLQHDGSVLGYSIGWTTNHVMGDYFADGAAHNYEYFIKIVFVGLNQGDLWKSYTITQEVNNDPYAGTTGLSYLNKELGPGLGNGPAH